MNKIPRYIVFLLDAALICAPKASAFDVRMTGDRLSVHADKDLLQVILQRLSDLKDIKIRIDPQINPKITSSFENRDIRQALDSILKPYGYVLIWETVEGTTGAILKLTEIRVFEPGKENLMKPLGKRLGTKAPEKLRQTSPKNRPGNSPYW